MVSGAPISARTAAAGHQVFGDTMYQLYGQTEAVPVTFMGPREWFGTLPGSDPLRAAGRIMPFAELEIRDEDNQAVPVGTEGEIAIRCEGQMTSLWDEPEQTAARLRDGWVLTGDIGRVDEHGFLYVIDRVDDMIVSGGFNIWPAELEQVISALPGVREVVAFGVPDDKWGETPLAEVILDDGAALDGATVIAACVAELGSYKKPAQVVFRHRAVPAQPGGQAAAQGHPGAVLGRAGPAGSRLLISLYGHERVAALRNKCDISTRSPPVPLLNSRITIDFGSVVCDNGSGVGAVL